MPSSFQKLNFNNNIKAALLLLILAVVLYSNSLGGEFVYDDEYFIVKNIHIRNLENIPSFFVNPQAVAFAELAQDVYRPLTTISYAFDYRLWHLDTFGYHLENVLLHGLNGILLFILLHLIFGDILIAFLASLLFVCHPVQTEVVAWISGRSSALFLFFYLASFIFYALYARRRNAIFFAISLALGLTALFSKEMAISLPLLLVAYDIHFTPKEKLSKKVVRWAPYFLLTAFFVAIRFLVMNKVGQCGWWGGNPYYTFLSMMAMLGEYARLLVWPVNLCAFYVSPVHTSFSTINVILPALGLTVLIAAMPYIFKRSRGISFAICLFFITLLPVSNIVPLKALIAERFLYLPSIGFCIVIAILLDKLTRIRSQLPKLNYKKLAIGIAIILVIFYSARTMMRNEDWRSPIAITNSILKLDPLNPWALTALGVAYSDQARYKTAIFPLAKAIALAPEYFAPKNVLGFCYTELGRYDDAVNILNDALKIKPYNLEALSSMGVAMAQLKRYQEAIGYFEKAIKTDPSFIDGYINLATTYDQMAQSEKAIRIYSDAADGTRSAQAKAVIYLRIGDIYKKLNNSKMAKDYYEKSAVLCSPGMAALKKIIEDRLVYSK